MKPTVALVMVVGLLSWMLVTAAPPPANAIEQAWKVKLKECESESNESYERCLRA